jgi:hypothetical protein
MTAQPTSLSVVILPLASRMVRRSASGSLPAAAARPAGCDLGERWSAQRWMEDSWSGWVASSIPAGSIQRLTSGNARPSMLTREEQATNAGRSGHAFAGASCPARDRAVSTTGRGRCVTGTGCWPVIVMTAFGDRWPSGHPALSGWPGEPAAPVHCPPWWPRAPTTCYGTRGRRGRSLGGCSATRRRAAGRCGYRPRHEPGKGWCTHPPEGLRPGPLPSMGGAAVASVTCPQTNWRGARG